MSDDLAALAADAYVYGFPLVFDVQEVGSFLREGMGSVAPGPFNSFSHASKLAGPEERYVVTATIAHRMAVVRGAALDGTAAGTRTGRGGEASLRGD